MFRKETIPIIVTFLLLFAIPTNAQKLVVHHLDSGAEAKPEIFEIGDVAVFAYQMEGQGVHYFQGKITGIFLDRNQVRVFDFARSTRVVSLAGKKIDVNSIVGVKKMDEEAYQSRESGAVTASVASAIGAAIGGKAGNVIGWGSVAAEVGIDLTTREQISKQKIKVEIEDV